MPPIGEIIEALSAGGNGSGFRVYARVGGIDVDLTSRGMSESRDERKRAADGSLHTAGCAELEYTDSDDATGRPNSYYKVSWQRDETRHRCWTRDLTPPWVPLIPTDERSDDKPATEEKVKIGQSDLTVNGYPMMYIHVDDRGTEAQTIVGVSSDRKGDSSDYYESDRNSAIVREWLQSHPGDIPPEMRRIMADTVRWYHEANVFSSPHQSGEGEEETGKGELLAKMIAGSFNILPQVDQIKRYFPFMDCWAVPRRSLELLTRRSIEEGDEQDSSWTKQRRQEQWSEIERDSRKLRTEIPFLLHRIKPVSDSDRSVSYLVVRGLQRYHSKKELNGSTTYSFRGVNISSWYARTADPEAVQPIPSEIFATQTTFSPAMSELVTLANNTSQDFIQDAMNLRYGNISVGDPVAVANIGGRERLDRITRIANRVTKYGHVWECRDDYAEAFLAIGMRMGVERVGMEDSVKVARKSMCTHATLNDNGFFDEESLREAMLSEEEYQDLKSEIEYRSRKEEGTNAR